MIYRFRSLLLLLPMLLLFGACHTTPDHAHYIPKNALMVAEVNTKSLSKKIAWSLITGSSLLDKLRGSSKDSAKQADFIKNMSEAGVDELNTFYVYAKQNGAGNKLPCFVALIPLKDAMKWEQFIKKTFTSASIKDTKKRKEARLTPDIYAGWTSDLLIVVSVQDELPLPDNGDEEMAAQPVMQAPLADKETLLTTHLEAAFNVTKETSLLEDKRFTAFEDSKHDFGFWVNIEEVMNSYGAPNLSSMTGGLSLSNNMYKNSAFSAATNFEKGRIITDLLVYSPEDVKEINEEFARKNIDNDIIDRVPAAGLDYLLAYHLAPEGLRKMLDKMGVSGLANGYLKEQNLSIQEITDAISGDLVFSMNNFSQKKEMILFDSTDENSAISTFKMDMDMLFALKINKKESFRKLVDLAVKLEMIQQVNANTYMLQSLNGTDSSLILLNDQYAVFSNKGTVARNYLNGSNTKQTSMLVKDNVYQHPFGMFFDYQAWSKGISGMMSSTPSDSLVFDASRKIFDNYIFNGGSFKDNTLKYQMTINFVNKQENSLLQLLDFANTITAADLLREREYQRMEEVMAQDADTAVEAEMVP